MKRKSNFRTLLQVIFFVLIALISINHTLVERGIHIPLLSSASLHALCPYGGVETFVAMITTGTMVKKVHESAVVLLAIILFMSVLFGPVFCSYVCPLGSVQEWLGKIGRKIFKKRYNNFIPAKIDKVLRYGRYIVLGLTVYLSTMSLKLVFEAYDPYYALFNFWTGEIAITSLIVLGVVIISSLFIERSWCKYACPFGALLGLTNLFSVFKIRRNTTTCTSCNLCTKECPMNIDVANTKVITNHQCISCGVCTSENICPEADTLTLSTKPAAKKNYSTLKMAITIVVILIAGIGIGKLTNTFITESTKIPRKITTGEFTGEYDPADIRGSFTFSDISNSFDIPVDILAEAFDVAKAQKEDFQVKSLEEIYDDIGTSSVRQFVALYKGLPYADESDRLPESALDILLENNKITKEQYDAFAYGNFEHSSDDENESLALPQEEEGTHSRINSSTTIAQAIELGLSLENLEAVLDTKITNHDNIIKDVAKDNGLRFALIKDELNELIQ